MAAEYEYTDTDFVACLLALGSVWAARPEQVSYWYRVSEWFSKRWPGRFNESEEEPGYLHFKSSLGTNQMHFKQEFYNWRCSLAKRHRLRGHIEPSPSGTYENPAYGGHKQ